MARLSILNKLRENARVATICRSQRHVACVYKRSCRKHYIISLVSVDAGVMQVLSGPGRTARHLPNGGVVPLDRTVGMLHDTRKELGQRLGPMRERCGSQSWNSLIVQHCSFFEKTSAG